MQKLQPVPRGPLRENIVEQLQELIISGALQPGERLLEADIAADAGTSRVPVREALLELAKDGWAELRPRQGARVHQPTSKEVQDVFELRTALEVEIARLAAMNATKAHVLQLREIIEAGAACIGAGDHVAAAQANTDFHRALAAASGNEVLAAVLSGYERRIRWYFSRVVATRGMDSWIEHGQIADAVHARDGEEAARRMRAHTEKTASTYRLRFS